MAKEHELLDVIDRLYGSLLDDAILPAAFGSLGKLMRCEHGTVFGWNTQCIGDPEPVGAYSSDWSRFGAFVDDYRDHYMLHDPTRTIAGRFPDGWFVDSRDMSAHDRNSNPMVNECIREHGFAGWAALEIKSGERMWALSFLRSTGTRDFGADDVDAVNRLTPHIARALSIRERVADLQRHLIAGHAALDLLSFALWIVDGARQMVFCNKAAEVAAASDGGVLTVRNRSICAHERPANDWLAQALQRATRDRQRVADARLVTAKDGALMPVRILPLPPRMGAAHYPARPLAAVVVASRAVPPTFDALLAGLYGLTKAEARVSRALLHGHGIEQIATSFKVKESTVLSQIKAIYAKTGVKKQTQLVTLLSSLAVVS